MWESRWCKESRSWADCRYVNKNQSIATTNDLFHIANPAYSPKWNTTFWTRNGNTVTMPCPIPIGALEQAYNIHWDVPPNSTHYKVSNVNYQSSLTIFNVQSNDYKAYTCTAVVRDPANGVPWNQMENVHLYRGISIFHCIISPCTSFL